MRGAGWVRLAAWLTALMGVIDVLSGLVIIGVAFHRMGRTPTAGAVLLSAAVLASATVILYSLWILVVSAAFFVVKVDNLSFLFSSIFDAARWPISVFRGAWRLALTVVVPLALMTTYPSLALLGRLEARTALLAALGSVAFAAFARLAWLRSISRYTSASS